MKALSIWQPWASLIVEGMPYQGRRIWKVYETRMWFTAYRGPLLICASKRFMDLSRVEAMVRSVYPQGMLGFPIKDLGMAIGVVDLVDCRPMRKEDEAGAFCPSGNGLYVFCLRNPRMIKPFAVRGQQGLFEVEVEP